MTLALTLHFAHVFFEPLEHGEETIERQFERIETLPVIWLASSRAMAVASMAVTVMPKARFGDAGRRGRIR